MATATTTDPYSQLNSTFAYQLHQLVSRINANGGNLSIASGHRSRDEQADLYNKAIAKYGQANAANWAAPPGSSNHELGLAVDLSGSPQSVSLAHQLASQYGLNFPLQNEAWHVEPVGIRQNHNNQGGPSNSGPPLDGSLNTLQSDPKTSAMSALIGALGGQDPSTLVDEASTAQQTTPATQASRGNIGPTNYDALFQQAASKYGLNADLLKAVAKQESGFAPDVVNGTRRSSTGAMGLMQFMPGTAHSLGINPLDPAQAIDGAAQLLSSYVKQFGSVQSALAAYNAGPGAVQRYGGIPPYAETQNYVKNIMSMSGG